MRKARIFIMYGQYGIGLGMNKLAGMLNPYGYVTMHQWDDAGGIITPAKMFLQQEKGDPAVIIIGYSLGANSAPYYAASLPTCDLTISYDPSIYSPLVTSGVQPVSSKIDMAVCYWNTASWLWRGGYGGARLIGAHVETHKFQAFHLNVPDRMDLHAMSVVHVREVVEEGPKAGV